MKVDTLYLTPSTLTVVDAWLALALRAMNRAPAAAGAMLRVFICAALAELVLETVSEC
jgi:hypothetical protein